MNILMILTSHDHLGDSGKKTGFWLEEFAAPYYVFRDAGATIALASPKGGQPPLDPKSDEPDAQTKATERFKADIEGNALLAETKKLMMEKNHDYGEAWRNMMVSTFTDMILMRLLRIKQIMQANGNTIMSEGVESNLQDMINYSVFALIHLTINKKQ